MTAPIPWSELKQQDTDTQYSLAKILSIWAVVSLPMGLLAWVVAPALTPHTSLHPGVVYWLLMILGMAWQFAVSLYLLRRELGSLHWHRLRERIWLNWPRDPHTGRENPRLLWWVFPCMLFSAGFALGLFPFLDAPMVWLLSGLNVPEQPNLGDLATPQFKGQWWLLGVAVVSNLFNHLLGEELLFRGVLLPKMRGVFGRWDWLANAVVFGLYHLHKPCSLFSIIVSSLAFSWPARRFRSNWMAVIVHGAEGIFLLVLVLGILLGQTS